MPTQRQTKTTAPPKAAPKVASSSGHAKTKASPRSPSAARSTTTARHVEAPSRSRTLVLRQDGTERRRTTVYFDPELARRLNVYCAQHDLEMSQVVGEAVEALLTKKGG